MQQEMKYIYQVYKEGSFSKAAEKLYLTQPALSITIKKIEESLGMPLFDRSRRPLQVTQAGQIYIDTIKKIQSLESDLNRQINDIQDLKTGCIRIGGSHYLNAYILPEILSAFSQEYPGIHLELVENSSDQLADMLTDRNLDLTFSCNPVFMKNFERYPAFYDHILLAVPETDPIHQNLTGAGLSASDIIDGRHLCSDCLTVPLNVFQELEFILLSEGNNLYERSIQMFKDADVTPKIKMTLTQLVTAYHMAEHHFAAAFVSDRLVRNPNSRLIFYKLKSDLINRLFYILLPEQNYTSHAVKMFIQFFLLHV